MSNDQQQSPPPPADENSVFCEERPTLGQRFADAVTDGMGTWKFFIGVTAILGTWGGMNFASIRQQDSVSLMNLSISILTLYTTIFIMMSQKRTVEKDRQMAREDYMVDLDSQRDIKEINRKLDILLGAKASSAGRVKTVTQPAPPAPAAQQTPSNDDKAPAAKPADKMSLG